jgi:glycosyltransferase involved in cell wall biosynthesis
MSEPERVGQTVAAWEAIVVDDGSTTPSAALVAFAANPRVRVVRHEQNRGLAAARNSGIRAAATDTIVTLDADDMLDPAYLERVLPRLQDEDVNAVYTDFSIIGERRGVVHWGGKDEADQSTLLRRQWIPGPGVAFRRALWEAAGGYCEDEALRAGDEDRDFWISAMEAGLHPLHVPEPLYRYRVGHPSMMTRLEASAWRTHEAIYARHAATFARYHVGHAFLADGYVTSARIARAAGRRGDALRLAGRALRHEPWRLDAMGVVGRALLPRAVLDTLRRIRRRRAAAAEGQPQT